MRLAFPLFLSLLAIIIPLVFYYVRSSRRPAIGFPSKLPLAGIPRSSKLLLRHLPTVFRILAIASLIFALARPQDGQTDVRRSAEGLDVVLIVDTSRSMEARDFVIDGQRPTRLTVVKKVMEDFIRQRPSDRIGIVVFGSEAFTQAPLTLDHQVLLTFLDQVEIGVAGDATAIGDGLATAVNRLRSKEAKSKITILLTDGSNTAGRVDPLAAAQAALAYNVKLYTIGVGSRGEVPVVVDGRVYTQKVDIDEDLLRKIAELTGGQYYRATDTETLVNIYETIDRLEKTKIEVVQHEHYEERFATFVWAGLVLLAGEILMGLTRFRRIP